MLWAKCHIISRISISMIDSFKTIDMWIWFRFYEKYFKNKTEQICQKKIPLMGLLYCFKNVVVLPNLLCKTSFFFQCNHKPVEQFTSKTTLKKDWLTRSNAFLMSTIRYPSIFTDSLTSKMPNISLPPYLQKTSLLHM